MPTPEPRMSAHASPTQQNRRAQMTGLRQQVWAMAEAFEAGELMPGGGHLQATMDTAWNALVALCLGIDDWLEHHDDPQAAAALCATPTTTDGLLGQPPAVSALDQQRHNALAAAAGAGAAAGERAYAVWFRHTYPTAPQAPAYAWELLLPAHRALWEAIAQAVLHATDDQR